MAHGGCARGRSAPHPTNTCCGPRLPARCFPTCPSSPVPLSISDWSWSSSRWPLAVQLRLPGALVTVAALGLPLLFVIYRHQSGVYRDIPRSSLVITVALGIAIGVGWVLLTGDLVIRETGAPFDAGIAGNRVLRDGLGVAEGGALLMMIPAVVVRLIRPGARESLNGFVIGVLSALSFTAAATFTRLAPQFAAATVAKNRPVEWLVVEAAIRGVTIPLTAACAGGLLGAALWFRRSTGPTGLRRSLANVALVIFGVAVLGVYAIVGITDVAGLSQETMLAWHIAMALVALLALRIGLQLALLHEEPDPIRGVPQLCLHCRNVVPEMAFCPGVRRGHARLVGRSPGPSAARWSRSRARRRMPGRRSGRATRSRRRRYTSAPLSRTTSVRVLSMWAAGDRRGDRTPDRAVGEHLRAGRHLQLPTGLRPAADAVHRWRRCRGSPPPTAGSRCPTPLRARPMTSPSPTTASRRATPAVTAAR